MALSALPAIRATKRTSVLIWKEGEERLFNFSRTTLENGTVITESEYTGLIIISRRAKRT